MSLKLEGKSFNRLTAISVSHKDKSNNFHWNCLCSCGNYTTVSATKLKAGKTKSCGCYQLDKVTTHGMSKHPFYRLYDGMKQRCYNPNHKGYSNYGGRGITVCNEWRESFESFYEDMFSTYSDNVELDRIDTDGNYCKGNCRWVTRQQNAMNTRGKQNSTSRYKGVCWVSSQKMWMAQIMKDGKQMFLGYFEDEVGAANAYNTSASTLFGEYAHLNKINDELGL